MAGLLESLATAVGKKKSVKLTPQAQSRSVPSYTPAPKNYTPVPSKVTGGQSQVSKAGGGMSVPVTTSLSKAQPSSSSSPKSSSKSSSKKSSSRPSLMPTAYAAEIGSEPISQNTAQDMGGIGYRGTGNWLTPELGLTEMFGGQRSSLSSAPNNTKALTSYLGNLYGGSSITPMQTQVLGFNNITAPDVLGVDTSLSGSGSSDWYNQLNESDKALLEAQYGITMDTLSNQQKSLDAQNSLAESRLGSANEATMSEITKAEQSADASTEAARQQAYEQALASQRQNRNILRSLGILGSSAAGELLSRPMVEADRTAGALSSNLVKQKGELSNLRVQKRAEYEQALKELSINYQSAMEGILADQRFTLAEKRAATQQLQAAAGQRASEISQQAQDSESILSAYESRLSLI